MPSILLGEDDSFLATNVNILPACIETLITNVFHSRSFVNLYASFQNICYIDSYEYLGKLEQHRVGPLVQKR